MVEAERAVAVAEAATAEATMQVARYKAEAASFTDRVLSSG